MRYHLHHRKRLLASLAWLYVGLTFLAFFLRALSSIAGWWPSRLQVPWSDLGSFVETRDGLVLVELRIWGRIELCDRRGNFLNFWRRPPDKGDRSNLCSPGHPPLDCERRVTVRARQVASPLLMSCEKFGLLQEIYFDCRAKFVCLTGHL